MYVVHVFIFIIWFKSTRFLYRKIVLKLHIYTNICLICTSNLFHYDCIVQVSCASDPFAKWMTRVALWEEKPGSLGGGVLPLALPGGPTAGRAAGPSRGHDMVIPYPRENHSNGKSTNIKSMEMTGVCEYSWVNTTVFEYLISMSFFPVQIFVVGFKKEKIKLTNSRERHVLFGGMPRYPKACWWRQSAARNPKKARHKGIKDQPQLVLSFTAVGSQLLHSIVSTTMASHHLGKHLLFQR